MDATDWILPATPNTKYAHAPDWSTNPWSNPHQAACGITLLAFDPYEMDNEAAVGKPPCPKCVKKLRWHLSWLTEWADAYENLVWPEAEVDALAALVMDLPETIRWAAAGLKEQRELTLAVWLEEYADLLDAQARGEAIILKKEKGEWPAWARWAIEWDISPDFDEVLDSLAAAQEEK